MEQGTADIRVDEALAAPPAVGTPGDEANPAPVSAEWAVDSG